MSDNGEENNPKYIHSKMAIQIDQIIYEDTQSFTNIKLLLSYLDPQVVHKVKSMSELLKVLEDKGKISPGNYTFLLERFADMKYENKEVLDIIDDCTKRCEGMK